MANEEHLAVLKQGVEAWNRWRKENTNIWRPDLSGADLRRADLQRADLHDVNLCEANLHLADLYQANLGKVDFEGAYLCNANFSQAYLYRANLNQASLNWAHLNNANLGEATLCEAVLEEAGLSRADLSGTDARSANFTGADLSYAKFNKAYLWRTNLTEGNLRRATLRGAILSEANLTRAVLVETSLEGATLSGCRVFGISAWKLNLRNADQSSLIISDEGEPEITVDNLEVAQFVHLLLNNERIRDVINTITTKVVLILGRFTPERKAILDAIREALRRDGRYIPVLFDFDKPTTRDTHETVTTLARLARFVIADITDPKSIPQELVSIVEQMPSLPVQPLLQSGYKPWGMYDHIKRYPWVLELCSYDNLEALLTLLGPKVVEPAEAKAKELTAR